MTLNFDDVRKQLEIAGDRQSTIAASLRDAPNDGLILEFGVKEGLSLNWISADRPNQDVYGFDTFTGLPEDWAINEKHTMAKGRLKPKKMRPLGDNVTLIKGLFQDTLENWLTEVSDNVAFVHIDCDLYSSTNYVLTLLNDRIVPGTVILFDDLYRWGREDRPNFYAKWEEGEWKALLEWMEKFDRQVEPLYRCADLEHWNASFKVIK